jgi:hypothetical protein
MTCDMAWSSNITCHGIVSNKGMEFSNITGHGIVSNKGMMPFFETIP